jgi:hypothetical protein
MSRWTGSGVGRGYPVSRHVTDASKCRINLQATDYTIPISITLHVSPGLLTREAAARLPVVVQEAANAVLVRRGTELDGFVEQTASDNDAGARARKADVDPPKVRFSFSVDLAEDLGEDRKKLNEAQLDEALHAAYGPSSHGRYRIVILPTLEGASADAWRVFSGKYRTLLVFLPTSAAEPATSAFSSFSDAAVTVLTGVFGTELYHLRKSVAESTARQADVLRTVRYAREYLTTFTLLNADPNEVLATWDIEAAINGGFEAQVCHFLCLTDSLVVSIHPPPPQIYSSHFQDHSGLANPLLFAPPYVTVTVNRHGR